MMILWIAAALLAALLFARDRPAGLSDRTSRRPVPVTRMTGTGTLRRIGHAIRAHLVYAGAILRARRDDGRPGGARTPKVRKVTKVRKVSKVTNLLTFADPLPL